MYKIDRMGERGRPRQTFCINNHLLDEENTLITTRRKTRTRKSDGVTVIYQQRRCRACNRTRERRYSRLGLRKKRASSATTKRSAAR